MPVEPFVTVPELAVWARQEIAPEDPYALVVVQAATIAVTSYAGMDPAWTLETVPDRIKNITAQIAKRNWLNPTQLTKEGSIGPIGGDTYAAAMAAGMELTEYEMAEIGRLAGVPAEGVGKMSILTFTTGRGTAREPLYLADVSGEPVPYLDPAADPYYFPTVD